MKDLKIIKSEINSFTENNRKLTKVEIKRYKFLRSAQIYIESNPSKEYVKLSIAQLKAKLVKLDQSFKNFSRPPKYNGDLLQLYKRQMGYAKINNQIALMEFVL